MRRVAARRSRLAYRANFAGVARSPGEGRRLSLKTAYRDLRGDGDRDGSVALLALDWSGEQRS
jgi:hypothetical protein